MGVGVVGVVGVCYKSACGAGSSTLTSTFGLWEFVVGGVGFVSRWGHLDARLQYPCECGCIPGKTIHLLSSRDKRGYNGQQGSAAEGRTHHQHWTRGYGILARFPTL